MEDKQIAKICHIGSYEQAWGFNTILEEEGRKAAVGIWWNYILSIILGALRVF